LRRHLVGEVVEPKGQEAQQDHEAGHKTDEADAQRIGRRSAGEEQQGERVRSL
jgi:hypothetical protein